MSGTGAPINWIAVVAQVGQNIFYQMWTDLKVVLGTGGFQATVTLNFNIDSSRCR